MASSWDTSWDTSWGNSWGSVASGGGSGSGAVMSMSLGMGLGLVMARSGSGGGGGGPDPDAPTITGTGQTGTYLWGVGTAPFQWYKNGAIIPGETTQSYLVGTDYTKRITFRDASGLASNVIVPTWVRQTMAGVDFTLDMDAQNARYAFAGVQYTEAEFVALSWTPTITGNLVNKLFSTGSAPFPGWDDTEYWAIGLCTLTDNSADPGLVDFSDNTASHWAAIQMRWSANRPRLVVVEGGTQVNLAGGTLVTATQYLMGAKFKLNDYRLIDGTAGGIMLNDKLGTMPVGVTQMRTGNVSNGASAAAGTIERVTVQAGTIPMYDFHHAMLRTQLVIAEDIDVLENDGVDGRDIFGDGWPCIANSNQDGRVTLYRQTSRGVFTKTIISSTVVNAKVEGICFINSRGDGFYQLATCDQVNNEIRLYEPATPGNYAATTWPYTVIRSGRSNLQDVAPYIAAADVATGLQTLRYTFEGSSGGNGGISKLRWNGSSFTDTVIIQHSGAWGLSDEMFANGDILFSARNAAGGHNGGNVPGVYRVTQAGVQSTIIASPEDHLRLCIGDFFGHGNEDVANIIYDGTTEAFSLFDSANSWAETIVLHEPETLPNGALNFGIHNLHYQANGRDAILLFGNGRGSVWHWNGAAWAVVQRWDSFVAGHKSDDTIFRANITGRLKPDIVVADSIGNQLVVLALTT